LGFFFLVRAHVQILHLGLVSQPIGISVPDLMLDRPP